MGRTWLPIGAFVLAALALLGGLGSLPLALAAATFVLVRKRAGTRCAALSVLVLATLLRYAVFARFVIFDMMLAAFVRLSIFAGLAFLVKGASYRGLGGLRGTPRSAAQLTGHPLLDLNCPPGIPTRLRELLSRLPGREVIFTNAPRFHAEQALRLLALRDSFDEVVTLEDLAYRPKPDPRAYHIA